MSVSDDLVNLVVEELRDGFRYDDSGDNTEYEALARTILAAVAPLIAAAERERITAILEAQAAGWERARLGYRDRGDAEMATYIGSKEGALEVALAAIRATPPEDGG